MIDKKLFQETFSTLHASGDTVSEVLKMSKKQITHRSVGPRVFRAVLVGTLLVFMLATTAFAYVGFTQYENPQQMIEAFFGENGYTHSDGSVYEHQAGGIIVEPGFDREPVDETLAEELVEPYISAVGESVTSEGYTLTVEAYQYDSVTGCGMVYYSLANPDGISGYKLQLNGEIWWPSGELVYCNQPGEHYIVSEKTTDTEITVAYSYIVSRGDTLEIGFNGNNHTLSLPLADGGGMKSVTLADGAIQLSPVGLRLEGQGLGLLNQANETLVDQIVIRYADGTEYLVASSTEFSMDAPEKYKVTANYAYGLMDQEEGTVTYALNRIVDVDNVIAVVLDGVSYPVD